MKRLVVLCLFLFAISLSSVHALQTDSPWCVSVWYPSSDIPGGLDSISANRDLIGIINPFWYSPMPDGSIQAHPESENAALLAQWRADGQLIIPSIFSSISEMISDPALREFHVEQIVALVERMDYDGIDIDYEGFPANTRESFSLFMESLSAALHANGRLLTTAVHAKTDDFGAWEGTAAQDWARIAPAVDIFAIMTYDYTNRNEPPGPIGPPEWILDVLAYAATITDLSKVTMGLHVYGYSWLRESPPATTISWAAAQRLITTYGIEIERDPADMEARIDFKAQGLPRQTMVFADSVGIEYKLTLILDAFPDLGGVAIWGLGGEDPSGWEILRSVRTPDCRL